MHTIPFIDLRSSSLIALAEQQQEQARSLLRDSKRCFGIASHIASTIALPIGDRLAKKWLTKTQNPYREEITKFAGIIGMSGVYTLNLSYEWGCTSGVAQHAESPTLLRVLDWPFPNLGSYTVVAHQQGEAGDFYNVTWPALSGVFQAMAPGRFAAAINQAPMRRHNAGIVRDWAKNRRLMWQQNALPPAHLLRYVFEQAKNYQEATQILSSTPISVPVIYSVSGMDPDEGCVIERLENQAAIRTFNEKGIVGAANHFTSDFNGLGYGWLSRPIRSHDRAQSLYALRPSAVGADMKWFQSPIANRLSRLVMIANAKERCCTLRGMAGVQPATELFSLSDH